MLWLNNVFLYAKTMPSLAGNIKKINIKKAKNRVLKINYYFFPKKLRLELIMFVKYKKKPPLIL